MQLPPPTPRGRRNLRSLVVPLAAVAMVVSVAAGVTASSPPAPSQPAAVAAAPPPGASGGYTTQSRQCIPVPAAADGSGSGEQGNGQRDMSGVLWQVCAGRVVRDDGSAPIALPYAAQDVAPAPDGQILYVMADVVHRMLRQPDGSFADDPDWHLDTFPAGGTNWTPTGVGIATDAWGDIYVSNGGWRSGQPNVIVKYGPDGHLKYRFGDYGTGNGQFNVAMGLAVTPDGRKVYVADHLNCRVQRFDYRPSDASYQYAMQWGGCDTNNAQTGKFSAVYDVALDRQGYVYVADTTWNRMQRFTADGVFVEQVWATPYSTAKVHTHYVAVDRAGNFNMAETDQWFQRTTPDNSASPTPTPLAAPDTTSPGAPTVTAPSTSNDRAITVSVDAHDDAAVTELRWAREDGVWQPWEPYGQVVHAQLSSGVGPKRLSIQVRDGAHNESPITTTSIQLTDSDPPTVTALDATAEGSPDAATLHWHATASDDASAQDVQVRVDGGAWTAWQPLAGGAAAGTLPGPGGGPYLLEAQARDSAGKVSAVRSRAVDPPTPTPVVTPEPTPTTPSPTAPGPTATGGGSATTQQAVDRTAPLLRSVTATIRAGLATLHVRATDAVGVWQVRTRVGSRWSAWRPATDRLQLRVPAAGLTVRVQVRDRAGNRSAIGVLHLRRTT